MAAIRFRNHFDSFTGDRYTIEIWDREHAGAVTEFITASDGFTLSYENNGRMAPVMGTQCKITMKMENPAHEALITDLQASEEGRFLINITTGVSSPEAFWKGLILPDIGQYNEEYYPTSFVITATDGIGALRDIKYNNDGTAYTGKERVLQHIVNCLTKIKHVDLLFDDTDNFISSYIDWWETNMTHASDSSCALYQTYLNHSVWYKYDKGVQDFVSCYDVLVNIMTEFGARITFAKGSFWIEQTSYRTATTVIGRGYTKTGAFLGTGNFSGVNIINQTPSGALEAIGVYEFLPALMEHRHTFKSQTRRNFLDGADPFNSTNVGPVNIYRPIDKNSDKTTLRFTGNMAITIKSLTSAPGYTNVLDPFCLVFRMNFTLDSTSLQRLYTLFPNFQIDYDPITWGVTPGFYIVVPINVSQFLANTTDQVLSLTQSIDVMTPPLTENCDDFSVAFVVDGVYKFEGGTYSITDFEVGYTLDDMWLEVYSEGTPALTNDEFEYECPNVLFPNNSVSTKSETLIGTTGDPNTLGALWVKPASTYILGNTWGDGSDTPDKPIESVLCELVVSGQTKPLRKLGGTLHGNIDSMSRLSWKSVYWILLGGSWQAGKDQFSGEWAELQYATGLSTSPPKKKKLQVIDPQVPVAPTAGNSSGTTYELVQKPPGTLFGPLAITSTSDTLMLSGPVTSINIGETLTDGDFYDGDTVAILNPITGKWDDLEVTATTAVGETAIAVTGTLTGNYPKNSLIFKKPKIGTFSLPLGVLGDILYYDGDRWSVLHIGSTGEVLTVTAGVPAWAAGGGYTNENAQDAVGNILVDSAEIDFTYDDAAPSITAVLKTLGTAGTYNNVTVDSKGRVSAGSVVAYLTANQTITLSGDVTGSGSTSIAATIAANAVTTSKIANDAVTYGKIQNVSTNNRILGRITAGAGDVEELTAANMQTILGYIDGSLNAGRIPYASDGNTLTDDDALVWDFSNNFLGVGVASPAAIIDIGLISGSGASVTALRTNINASSALIWYLINAGLGSSFLEIQTTVAGGDPFLRMTTVGSGGNTWTVGIDNSDTDAFKISKNSTPGASVATDYVIISTTGLMSIGGAALVALVNLYINGTGAVRVPSGNDAQRPSASGSFVRNNSEHGGLEAKNANGLWNRLSGTSFGSCAAGLGAGTSGTPTVNVVGTDMSGVITLVAGTSPAANGILFTFNYGKTFHGQPYPVLFPANDNAANTKIYADTYGSGSFVIKIVGTLGAGTYKWTFNVKD